jgi:diguanylate cyclase (GGDEF)-like protein
VQQSTLAEEHRDNDRVGARDPLADGELGLITRDVTIRTGAEIGLLAVRNQTSTLFDVICAWGDAWIDGRLPPPAGRRLGFVGRVLSSGHAAFGPINPARDPILGAARPRARLRHAAGAPILPPGGPAAALCVAFSDRPRDPALTPWIVERFAGLAALCMYDSGVLDGLLAAARVDGLTGLLNYSSTRAELVRELARSARHGRPLACCFIDLDHFKRVNEDHGFLDGSRTLADVAEVLSGGVRVGDTIGRFGGDEFLVILPDTDHDAACGLGERLQTMISTARPAPGHEPLSVSVGVAQWQPGATVDDLLSAADVALRRAKRLGGGIVVGASGVAAATPLPNHRYRALRLRRPSSNPRLA